MVKIRMKKMGAKKRPYYRIVVIDSQNARDGKFIEQVGTYHPIAPDAEQLKFDAEKFIFESKDKGLSYNIYRVGNLTARNSDGVFQKNKDENAFYNILKFIALNKSIPKDMMDQSLEFTPVDLCAEANCTGCQT